jgi:SulP family sulfate permease
MELIAQGLGNVVSPLFQGIPATGAIARTATNIKNGGRTPIAGIVHALVLVLIMRCFGNLAALIPMSALAAILIHVAYNMSEWHAFIRALKYPKGDVAVLLATFFLTVFVDLTFAIEVGVVLSAFLFVKSMESAAGIEKLTKEFQNSANSVEPARSFSRSVVPEGVEVFELFGPIFFSAVERFSNALVSFEKMPKVLILYTPEVDAIDGSGLRAIQGIRERAERAQCTLLIAGANGQPLDALKKAEVVPAAHLIASLDDALSFASSLLAGTGEVRGSGSSPG